MAQAERRRECNTLHLGAQFKPPSALHAWMRLIMLLDGGWLSCVSRTRPSCSILLTVISATRTQGESKSFDLISLSRSLASSLFSQHAPKGYETEQETQYTACLRTRHRLAIPQGDFLQRQRQSSSRLPQQHLQQRCMQLQNSRCSICFSERILGVLQAHSKYASTSPANAHNTRINNKQRSIWS